VTSILIRQNIYTNNIETDETISLSVVSYRASDYLPHNLRGSSGAIPNWTEPESEAKVPAMRVVRSIVTLGATLQNFRSPILAFHSFVHQREMSFIKTIDTFVVVTRLTTTATWERYFTWPVFQLQTTLGHDAGKGSPRY
jgi:hypothetical protein